MACFKHQVSSLGSHSQEYNSPSRLEPAPNGNIKVTQGAGDESTSCFPGDDYGPPRLRVTMQSSSPITYPCQHQDRDQKSPFLA
ncbi:hypothetical protein Hypma_006141 [Hypsizygus marmoreus]|uniref:Uncharacterized protein n=1 Tax=Hypsizygus marmoreus TaxID=39966 RepID=A0A369JV28_HYPMA|nr:hypothetical protein Hypma_006141 [Hypsizygus marmoreus]